MPLLDVTIPEGALTSENEDALLARLTDVLLEHEGADPSNPVVRQIAWVFLHRPAKVFVAGAAAPEPRYKVVTSTPEGQMDDERRASMVAAVTEAILDAEEGAHPRDPGRVWVFPTDVPDGTWGAAGQVFRLADIVGFANGGDVEKAREYAARRLAKAREAAPV